MLDAAPVVVAPAAGTPAAVVPPAAVDGAPPAAVAAVRPPEPRPDPMAPRFAALAKGAQKLARDQQAWAAERTAKEQALKAQEDAISARAAKAEAWEKAEQAAKSDPGSYLRKVYGDNWYDLVTEYKLKGESAPPPDMAVQAVREQALSEVERVRKENADRWEKFEAERKAATEAERSRALEDQKSVIQQWETDTVAFVNGNVEKYELISQTESQALVLQVIKDTFAKSRRVLTAEEAADAVEKHLEGLVEKVTTGKKWQSRTAAKPAPTEERSSEAARTLTNGNTAGASIPAAGAKKDRYALALEVMDAKEREVAARAAK